MAKLWEAAVCLWNQDAPGALVRLGATFGEEVSPHVPQLKEAVRGRVFDQLGAAYSSIAVRDVAPRLGLEEGEAVEFCTGKGWLVDEGDPAFLLPKASRLSSRSAVDEGAMQRLLEHCAMLENHVAYAEQAAKQSPRRQRPPRSSTMPAAPGTASS